jgi:ribosome-binding factor A
VRNEVVAATLKRAIQEILARGLHDPRVRGLISVTSVEVTHDRADATVMVSVLPEEHAELTLHGLRSAAAHVRSALAGRVSMRRLPRLSFRLDESLKKEAAVSAALAEGRRRQAGAGPSAPPLESPEPP